MAQLLFFHFIAGTNTEHSNKGGKCLSTSQLLGVSVHIQLAPTQVGTWQRAAAVRGGRRQQNIKSKGEE